MSHPQAERPVLFVDDEHDIRVTMRDWLEAHGFVVQTAANGAQALTILAAPPKPFLLILDIKMPIMGGWELLDRVKSNPDLADIPVVVISAQEDRTDDRLFAKLRKPADMQVLLQIVTAHAGRVDARGSGPVAPVSRPPKTRPPR